MTCVKTQEKWCVLLYPFLTFSERDFMFDHNIPYIFVFHARDRGCFFVFFCRCLLELHKCSKNMDRFLKKKIIQ